MAVSLVAVVVPADPVAVAVDVRGPPLRPLVVVLRVERDRLLVVQALEAVLVDRREVDEDVLPAVVGGDEAEALLAEELDLPGDALLGLPLRHGQGRGGDVSDGRRGEGGDARGEGGKESELHGGDDGERESG